MLEEAPALRATWRFSCQQPLNRATTRPQGVWMPLGQRFVWGHNLEKPVIRIAFELNYSEVNYSSSCCGYPLRTPSPHVHHPSLVPSDHRLLSSTLPARPINNREEERQAAQAGEHGGRQVDLVQAGVLVVLQVAVRVAMRFMDHHADGRQVEHGSGHVVRQVGAQPALPAQQRHKVLLVQEGEEEKGEGEEPEQDSNKQDEVDGAFIFVSGDGDPEPGSKKNLQDPEDSQKALYELQDIPPHLRLWRLGWHLSPPPITLAPFLASRAGAFCQLQTAGEKMVTKKRK